MRASIVACGLVLMPFSEIALAGEFPAMAFLQRPQPAGSPRFAWPAPSEFERVWSGHERRVVRLMVADLSGADAGGAPHELKGVLLSVWPGTLPGHYDLRVEATRSTDQYAAQDLVQTDDGGDWRLSTGELGVGSMRFVSGKQSLKVTATYISPVKAIEAEAWTAWSYTVTLLTREGSVYDLENRPKWAVLSPGSTWADRWAAVIPRLAGGADPQVSRELAELVAGQTPAYAEEWALAVAWARAHDPELALQIYRMWRPMGRCSMDERPQTVAREYAELCHARGRLSCFLQLQVQIMGNQFARMASSSMAERAHDPEASRLLSTGIDVERFFLGLTFRFAPASGAGRELPPWRIGKAAQQAMPDRLAPAFLAAATSPKLDEYNRFRAASAWLGLLMEQRDDFVPALDTLDATKDLPPSVRALTALHRADWTE